MDSAGSPQPPRERAVDQRVALALGSNLGRQDRNLQRAVDQLRGILKNLTASSVYETRPLYVESQPPFLNACAVGRTRLDPRQLLSQLRDIERAAGRVRGERYGPRTLDLDLLLYGEERIDTPELTVPHPRLRERAFVLVPLAEVAPDWVVPSTAGAPAATVAKLAETIGREGIWKTDIGL